MNCDTSTIVARSPSIVSFGICYYYYYDYDYYPHVLRIAKQPPKQPTSQPKLHLLLLELIRTNDGFIDY